MEISTNIEGTKASLNLDGKLTVQTSPELEAVIDGLDASICDLDIDLSAVDYVASAGLRVFVAAEKMVTARGGTMRLIGPIPDVTEVFNMTGLSDVFTIEEK